MRSSDISALTNEELLASLKTIVGDERRLMATMLEYLAEVDARRLYAEQGCPSMFDFCQRRLGFSEDQSCRRIAVARLGHKFPQVFAAIREGRLHLSSADKLESLFTPENVDTLIAEASGKSMREVEHLKARLAPKPHVPESMRKLPKPRATSTPAGPADPADVSRATKREVHERDGSQCTFVSAAGERCPARERLELDHRHPRALGGKGDTSNIRLLCRAHNRYEAELTIVMKPSSQSL